MRLQMPMCLLFSAVLLACIPAPAAASGENKASLHLLTREQGLAVVRVTSAHRQDITTKPDCSHFVHQIYRFAGFPYPYANSLDLYDGVESFRRVNVPHPGDLIVWRGHVGIVTDPKKHAFFSAVRSGLRDEYYDQPYWRARGRPRFYRYVLANDHPILAADTSRTVRAPQPQSHMRGSPAANTTAGSEPEVPASAAPEAQRVAPSLSSTLPDTVALQPPSSILVASAGVRPTAEEVEEAISELNSASGVALRNGANANPARTLLIYDQLKFEHLDLKRDHGSARVEVEGSVSITGEKLERKHRRDKVRWELRRSSQGWQLLAPPDRLYVPRDVALRVLANRLALLTENEQSSDASDLSTRQEARIVQTLNFLFDQQ